MSDMDAGLTPGAPVPRATVPADVDLHRVWTEVAAEVWRRRPGPLERAAGRLLRSPGLARALVATPSLLVAASRRNTCRAAVCWAGVRSS